MCIYIYIYIMLLHPLLHLLLRGYSHNIIISQEVVCSCIISRVDQVRSHFERCWNPLLGTPFPECKGQGEIAKGEGRPEPELAALLHAASASRALWGPRVRSADSESGAAFRGSHLSNTTCLTQVSFKVVVVVVEEEAEVAGGGPGVPRRGRGVRHGGDGRRGRPRARLLFYYIMLYHIILY